MRKIKTQRSAKGYRDLNADYKTTRFVTNRRLPPRTAEHIWHAHALKGIREIPRAGWASWEPAVAAALRDLEVQRYSKANRYYSALERNEALLQAIRVRSEALQVTARELEEANEKLELTNKEIESANKELGLANRELELTNKELETANRDLAATTQRLEYTSNYLQTMMDSMLDILTTTDVSGAITDVNRATERLTGHPREALIGRPFQGLFTDVEAAQAVVEKALAEKNIADYRLFLSARDGQVLPVNCNATVLQDPEGRTTGVLFALRDITERLRVEEALTRQALELKRSNDELEQFAYVASHDLQEPLRKVMAFGDRLKTKWGEGSGEEGGDYLERMQEAAKRMQVLINDLLSLSRVTTRAQPFAQVDLGQVAQTVVSDLEVQIEQTGGRVEMGELPTLEADETQMRQLLQNLIHNALKFHREDAPPVVKVYGRVLRGRRGGPPSAGERCQVFVEDNGIGFEEKYADRIFGVFQRLHGRSDYGGTGIGLPICRKIAERHGGSIVARSEPGKGARFIITLPVAQVKEETLL